MLCNEYDADPSHSKPSCVDPVESPVRRGMSIHVPSAMTAQTAMDNALDLHRAGRLAEAAAAYRAVLAEAPNLLAAVHGLGLVAVDLDQTAEGIPLLARCVAAAPDDPAYRCSLGLALLKTGQAEAAAVALLPAANAAPHLLQPRLLLARALGALERWHEANDIMVPLTAAFPRESEAWAWRAHCENRLGDLAASEQSLRRALDGRPEDPELLNNLGVALRGRGQLAEAAETYRRALAHAPDHALSHANLGNVLGAMGDARTAEFHLRRAVILDPGFIDGHYNLGAHLLRQDRPEEAVPHLRHVLATTPDRHDALTNLGVGLVAMNEMKEAETCYRRAIALKPGNAEAHYDLAWLLLLTGRWQEGWREYEWRWEMPSFSSRRRTFTAPLWDGRTLSEGTLLLHAEQGLGDAIQFVRYANLARARCRRLIIECPRPMLSLFQAAATVGLLAGEIVAIGDPHPAYDAQAPFMTLPRLFASTPDNVPAQIPYLVAPQPAGAFVIPGHGRKRIGLVWAGSPFNKMDAQRSTPAHFLLPLLETAPADFVSLQIGPGAEQTAIFPSDQMVYRAHEHVRDFADTAALISQLDLVIGADTAVLHLAGALGKPAWMALAAAADYRWLQGRQDSPWYPAMRLFRQQNRGDWGSVITALQAALTTW